MLLRIKHQTDLNYTDLISESVMELRMAPRQEADQHRLSFQLSIGPAASVANYFDWLGNIVHTFSINPFHQQIQIVADSVVETDREVPNIWGLSDVWPIPRESLDYTLYDYLQFGGPIVNCAKLRDLASSLGPRQGASLGKLCLHLMQTIDQRYTYEKGATTAASPITEILEHCRGVCQDFTHLMIGLARVLGIPARYVSGFICREDEQTRGYAQTHAWCELYLPSTGWIGFDPTNNCLIGGNFVKVATGRDFRDVPPNRGLYRGKANEKIDVAVEMIELPAIPPALVSERYHSLDLEVFPQRRMMEGDLVSQQQEQQQQELRQQQEQQQQQSGC
jgi:transglutaminase-like putative cysteine protease